MFLTKISYHEQAFALRQLAVLVAAGHTVPKAAQLLSRYVRNRLQKALLSLAGAEVKEPVLGPYLHDRMKEDLPQAQRAEVLHSVADFTQRVGDELDRHRALFRRPLWPIPFFFLTFLTLAPLREIIIDSLSEAYNKAAIPFPAPTQIELTLIRVIERYPLYFLLWVGGFLGGLILLLKFAWDRGWLPGSSHARSRLLAEALRCLCIVDPGREPSLHQVAQLLPEIPMFTSLRRQLSGQPDKLPLAQALARLRGMPPELQAAVQAGSDAGSLRVALEGWSELQERRQRTVNARITMLSLFSWWFAILLLGSIYFLSFATAMVKLLSAALL